MKIRSVHGRELLDSRGNPTVEAEVTLSDGSFGSALVPSGLSTSKKEAHELRDASSLRWGGKGVLEAVSNIDGEISRSLVGTDAEPAGVDRLMIELDGTPTKSRLGANAILAVSLANARAVADSRKVPLYELVRELSGSQDLAMPTPMVNVLSGGLHAHGMTEMQDFLVVPLGATSFRMAVEWVGSVYRVTRELLRQRGMSTLLADEGGFGARLGDSEGALKLLLEAISNAGLEAGEDVFLAVDAASSNFFHEGKYTVDGRAMSGSELVDLFERWVSDYPIVSLEDCCAEDDWAGWAELTSRLGSRVQLLGDDLFATNPSLIETGGRRHVANAALIKLNQIGTLTETLESVRACRTVGFAPVVSARSGDTEDAFLADLAVGTAAGQIKVGSLARSERTAKYNRLLRMEERLDGRAPYSGPRPFPFLRARRPR